MIPASQPVVVPPLPERVYDRYAIESIQIEGDGIAVPVRAFVRFVLCRVREDGTWEHHPDGRMAQLHLSDVYAAAAERPDLAAVMVSLTQAIVAIAQDQNLL